MIVKAKSIFLLLMLQQTITVFSSYADLPNGVIPGMDMVAVQKRKGQPLEKLENEVTRIIIWRYKDGIAKFYDGKIIQEDNLDNIKYKRTYVTPKNLPNKSGEKTKSKLTQKEVDEIINSIPNDTGKPPQAEPPLGGASSQ